MNENTIPGMEQAVVGCLLRDRAAIRLMQVTIRMPRRNMKLLFSDPMCSLIIDSIFSLPSPETADPFTVEAALMIQYLPRDSSKILKDMMLQAVPLQGLVTYLESLYSLYLRRELKAMSSRLAASIDEGNANVPALLEEAGNELSRLRESTSSSFAEPISNDIPLVMKRIEDRMRSKGMGEALPTGFTDLDQLTGGMQAGELIVIGSRPGMGKSCMLVNMAFNLASQHHKKVAVLSLEEEKLRISERMLIMASQVEAHRVRSGRLEPDAMLKLIDSSRTVADLPIYIADMVDVTLNGILELIRSLVNNNGVEAVYLECLQHIRTTGGRSSNRESELGFITQKLKQLAVTLRVPIVVTSQLSRKAEARGSAGRPFLADLRDSGSIEEFADKVFLLYRLEYYQITEDENGNSTDNLMEVMVQKNKSGRIGLARLKFEERCGMFTKYEPPLSDLFDSLWKRDTDSPF